jgi:two-component system NtrC family sensor kinase
MFEEILQKAQAEFDAVRGLAPHDPVRIDRLNQLAYALRLVDGVRSFETAQEALNLAEERGYLPGIAEALRVRTFMGATITNVAEGRALAERALAIHEFMGNTAGRAALEDRLATLEELGGNYGKALEHATSTLELAEEAGDRARMGWALSSLGGVHAALDDEERALKCYERAQAIFHELEDPIGVFRLAWRLTALHRNQGRYELAFELSEECMRLASEGESIIPRLFASVDRARCLIAMGRMDEARADLEWALQAMPEQHGGDPTLAREVRATLGRISLREGRLEEARAHLESTIETAEQIGANILALHASEDMAELEERSGRPQEALVHLRRATEIRRRVFDVQTRRAVAREAMRAEVEAAQKDAEIHRLRYVELERMQAQLVEAERLALLGDLAAGIAHEANTPLGVVKSNLQLLAGVRRRLDGDAADRRAAVAALETATATTTEAVERLEHLISGLRRFARLDEAEEQRIDLADSMAGVLELFAGDLPDAVSIVRDLRPAGPVWGWAGQLNQALLALLNNARHAVEGAGTIRIETRTDGAEAVVVIVDDGRGIPTEDLESIFRPGFGSKERRVRFRLGLASVASIVRKHGGRIDASSDATGSRFEIRLPLDDAAQ